jgi:hypothetical protein
MSVTNNIPIPDLLYADNLLSESIYFQDLQKALIAVEKYCKHGNSKLIF